jgi:hypothetical protein
MKLPVFNRLDVAFRPMVIETLPACLVVDGGNLHCLIQV